MSRKEELIARIDELSDLSLFADLPQAERWELISSQAELREITDSESKD